MAEKANEFGLDFVSVRLKHDRTLYSEEVLDTPQKAVDLLIKEMGDFDREYFVMLNLSSAGQVVNASIVSMGGLNSTSVSPREIYKTALLSNAAYCVFLHNHPSGSLKPSKEDDEITKRLLEAGNLLGVPMHDHIIVGANGDYFSYEASGRMGDIRYKARNLSDYAAEPKASYDAEPKQSFRDKVAEAFIASLEEDPKNWVKKWASNDTGRPFNMASGREYNGVNAAWLKFIEKERGFEDPRWLTFNQVQKLNEQRADDNKISIPKGTKMTPVEYFFMWDNLAKKTISWEEYNNLSPEEQSQRVDTTTGVIAEDGLMGSAIKPRFELRSRDHYVFNASQLENMPEFVCEKTVNDISPSVVVDRVATGMGVTIREEEQDRAFYRPSTDTITLPLKTQFASDYDYQSTALHELGHATGHSSRLNRDQNHRFGSPEYAYEELIAEMTSAFMGEYIEEPMSDANLEEHTAYIQNWIAAINNDKNYLFRAIKEAEKAADYMIEKGDLKELTLTAEKSIVLTETGREYDFIATLENISDSRIEISPVDSNAIFGPFIINAHDWVGLEANEGGYAILEAVKNGEIDYEKIIEEPEKITEDEMRETNRERLAKEIDDALSGVITRQNAIQILDHTPKLLRDLGLEDLPILFTKKHLKNCLREKDPEGKKHFHGLTKETLLNIPEYLGGPVVVMDSLDKEDSIVVVTPEVDGDGLPIIASLDMNGYGQYKFEKMDTNFLTSVYGHKALDAILSYAIAEDKVLYVDKEKALELGNLAKLTLLGRLPQLGLESIIHKSTNVVNDYEEDFLEQTEKEKTQALDNLAQLQLLYGSSQQDGLETQNPESFAKLQLLGKFSQDFEFDKIVHKSNNIVNDLEEDSAEQTKAEDIHIYGYVYSEENPVEKTVQDDFKGELSEKYDSFTQAHTLELVDIKQRTNRDDYMYVALLRDVDNGEYSVWQYNHNGGGMQQIGYFLDDESKAYLEFYNSMNESLQPPYRITMYSGEYLSSKVKELSNTEVIDNFSDAKVLAYANTEEEGREIIKNMASSAAPSENGFVRINQIALELLEYDDEGDLITCETIEQTYKPVEYNPENRTLEIFQVGENQVYKAVFRAYEGDKGFEEAFDASEYINGFRPFAVGVMKDALSYWQKEIDNNQERVKESLISVYSADAIDFLDKELPESLVLTKKEKDYVRDYFKERLNEAVLKMSEEEGFKDNYIKSIYIDAYYGSAQSEDNLVPMPGSEKLQNLKDEYQDAEKDEDEDI